MPETCRNPWNPDCKGTDIALDIDYEGKRLPICQKCWEKLGESNRELGIRMLSPITLDSAAYEVLLSFVSCKPYTACPFRVKRGFLS